VLVPTSLIFIGQHEIHVDEIVETAFESTNSSERCLALNRDYRNQLARFQEWHSLKALH
jgi:hypothetical protein